MSVPIPSIDRAALDAFKAGDESALERIVRQIAPAMCASALEEVGQASAASRAVEQAIVRAWTHRTEFESPEQLRALLSDELREAAMREKARRQALRRFEEHEGGGGKHAGHAGASSSIDQNELWEHIVKALHPDTAKLAAAKAEAANASRRGAASHIAGVGKGMSKTAMAGIVIGLGTVFGLGLFFLQRASASSRVSTALKSREAIQTVGKTGQRGSMKIADGSTIDLGAETSLTIPKGFPREMRALLIEGAAHVTVASGQKDVLEARAGNAIIKSAGGVFTVMANKNEPVTVRADTGGLTISSDTATRQLAEGKAARVLADGRIVDPTPDEVTEATSWTGGRLMVNNRTIKDILPMLLRWYNADVRAEPALLTRTVTMNALLGRTDSVIAALEKAGNVKQIYLKQQMVLVDAPPKKGK